METLYEDGFENKFLVITSLKPYHHRTDNHGTHWKEVFTAKITANYIKYEDGEDVRVQVAELRAKAMTAAMIDDAINRCERAGGGDCVVP
jgi:hypothetical protein